MPLMGNASIGKKIAAAFGVVLAVSVLTTGIGLWQMDKMSASNKALLELPLKKERLVSDWYRTIYGGSRRTLAIAKSSDNGLVTFFAEDSAQGSKQAGEIMKKVETLLTSDDEMRLLKQISEARDFYNVQKAAVTKAKEAGNAEEANRVLDQKFIPASEKYQTLLRDLLEMQRAEIDRSAALSNEASASSLNWQIALTGLLVLLVAACGFALKASIVKPLAFAIGIARRVAKGDLTADVRSNSRDEAGQLLEALGDMSRALRGLVAEVKQGAETIAGASGELAQGNADLSARTEQQASALEETASSMEELTSTVRQNADNARQANQVASSASAIAAKGGTVVAEVVQTMDSINEASKKIVDIITVIDGIAFQTNILALNAAVEAARAGEHGRGFAVVASEVRSLAQRSAAAAREVKDLIGDSVGKTNDGSRLVAEAGRTMDEVVVSVKRVTDLVAEISAGAQEQSAGIEQVNIAITQMDQTTQQNAALVEQAAAASGSMQQQASSLARAVAAFRVDDAAAAAVPSIALAPAVRMPAPAAAAPRTVGGRRGGAVANAPRTEPRIAAPTAAGGDWEEF